MRIANTNLPTEKRLIISLQYIYGIGPQVAERICTQAKVDSSTRVKDLTNDQQQSLLQTIGELGLILDTDLRREKGQNIKRLQDIGSYRGFRHRRRLPVNGQRTKTNARTVKGKKKTVANKKKVTK